MMNRYEFISDQYAGFNLEHTLGSGIFNYIPLVRKLKFRQFWTAKGVIGSLSDKNRALNLQTNYPFKGTLQGKSLVEVGTGVENILKFIRVDFVWRVAPKPCRPRSTTKSSACSAASGSSSRASAASLSAWTFPGWDCSTACMIRMCSRIIWSIFCMESRIVVIISFMSKFVLPEIRQQVLQVSFPATPVSAAVVAAADR
ncbi:hypothetical protein [Chitinophaga caseinilytica]|uniref:hypothetical protein n=1 Tax=Chitinophaga caseinilytica TaxID=2267521 RepID=UPI003C30524C